jgi:FixJ family two-component response regulator
MSSASTLVISPVNANYPIHAFHRDLPPQTASQAALIVFVVDDDIDSRRPLEILIRNCGWQPQNCDSVREFLARPRPSVPSVLILALLDSRDFEVQKRIAKECVETPIIVIADHGDIPTTVQAMKAGAVDVLTKPFIEELLAAAIRQGLARSRDVLNYGIKLCELRDGYASLSPREQQVFALVVSGLLNKQVGGELGISESTVKAHRGQVMQKMKARSFAQLVSMASRLRVTRSITLTVSSLVIPESRQ